MRARPDPISAKTIRIDRRGELRRGALAHNRRAAAGRQLRELHPVMRDRGELVDRVAPRGTLGLPKWRNDGGPGSIVSEKVFQPSSCLPEQKEGEKRCEREGHEAEAMAAVHALILGHLALHRSRRSRVKINDKGAPRRPGLGSFWGRAKTCPSLRVGGP